MSGAAGRYAAPAAVCLRRHNNNTHPSLPPSLPPSPPQALSSPARSPSTTPSSSPPSLKPAKSRACKCSTQRFNAHNKGTVSASASQISTRN